MRAAVMLKILKEIITNAAKNAAAQAVTVVVLSEYSPENGGTPISPNPAGPGRGSRYWDNVVTWVKSGDILTITGEVVDVGLGYFVVPVEYEGGKGYIDIDYIGLQE